MVSTELRLDLNIMKNSASKYPVKSLNSLCLMETNPPILQLSECSTVKVASSTSTM